MKKLFFAVLASACFIMAATNAEAGEKYGKKFSTSKAMTVKTFMGDMGNKMEAENVVVEGKIAQVCQAEGCWLKLKNEAGEDILVKFKDHAFLVPKDLEGNVIVNGTAVKKVISVDERKHMAEDAGATEEEIAAITTPKEELRIIATGLVVK